MAYSGSGQETTYTTGLIPIRQLDAHLYSTNKTDYPLLKAVGLDSLAGVKNTKIEWQYRSLMAVEDTLGAALDNSSTTVTPSNIIRFSLGDVLLIDSELLWVTTVGSSTLTCARGYAGTTAAAHSNGAKVYILCNARPEGSAPGTARHLNISTDYNYCQIFDDVAEVSGTQAAVDYYGVADSLDDRIDQIMNELYQKIERAMLYGRRYLPSDNTQARTLGGLVQFITNATDLSAQALTEADIIDVMQALAASVAQSFMPDIIVGNAWAKRKVTSFYAGTSGQPRTMERAERIGGYFVTRIETDFGTLDFVLDHLVKPDQLWFLNTEDIEFGPLEGRAFAEYDASTPGTDHIKRRVLGEYTMRVLNPAAMYYLYNFSTSS